MRSFWYQQFFSFTLVCEAVRVVTKRMARVRLLLINALRFSSYSGTNPNEHQRRVTFPGPRRPEREAPVTRRFITVFTITRQWSPPKPHESSPYSHTIFPRHIFVFCSYPRLGLSSGLFPSGGRHPWALEVCLWTWKALRYSNMSHITEQLWGSPSLLSNGYQRLFTRG
jgi:hypothetical protein